MTIRRYYDSAARRDSATVAELGTDERGAYVVLDQTLFHPQGGGQPADLGTIEGVEVTHVAAAGDDIRHYLATTAPFSTGQQVALIVDDARRSLHERLHTAGHLIGSVVELLFPQAEAVAGHHWPGESRVDFRLRVDALDPESIQFILEPELRRAVARNPKVYSAESAPGRRAVIIEGYRPIACGGTHVASVGEVGEVVLRRLMLKKDRLRIGYDVEANDA